MLSSIADTSIGLAPPGLIGPPTQLGTIGTIDHYELICVLGKGGMGIVFLARHSASGDRVAIKTLRAEFNSSPTMLERFAAEARHLQALKHPNIVPVLDVHVSAKGAWFVMPYFERGSLACRRGAALSNEEALAIASQVASALHHAHRKGITHRDLKPGNVLLGNDGSVCLADFGLARTVFNDSFVRPDQDQCEGTAPYMSPSVAAGEAEDTRCDVYGLGALLYEMLTGSPPYQGPSPGEIRKAILAGPPTAVLDRNRRANPHLARVSQWAMARNQRERYANMADFAADLARIEKGEEPLGPGGRRSRARAICSLAGRHRFKLAAGGLALAVYYFWPSYRFIVHSETTISRLNPTAIDVADVDGVPGNEYVFSTGQELVLAEAAGNILKTWPCPSAEPEPIASVTLLTPKEPGPVLAAVSVTEGTNLTAYLVNPEYAAIVGKYSTTGPPHHPTNGVRTAALRGGLPIPASASVSGRSLILFTKQTQRYGGPRALLAYDLDLRGGPPLWQTEFGPLLTDIHLADLHGDGQPEIVSGSQAPSNGIRSDTTETSDRNAYAFAVDQSGKLLWKRQLLQGFGHVKLQVIRERDSQADCVYAGSMPAENHHQAGDLAQSHLYRFDSQGHTNAHFAVPECLADFLVADLDGDRLNEVYVSNCRGAVFVLSPDLKQVLHRGEFLTADRRAGTCDHHSVYFKGAGNFISGRRHLLAHLTFYRQDKFIVGNSGKEQMKFSILHERLLLVDSRLKVRAAYHRPPSSYSTRSAWQVRCDDMDGDSLLEAVLIEGSIKVLKVQRH